MLTPLLRQAQPVRVWAWGGVGMGLAAFFIYCVLPYCPKPFNVLAQFVTLRRCFGGIDADQLAQFDFFLIRFFVCFVAGHLRLLQGGLFIALVDHSYSLDRVASRRKAKDFRG